MRAFLAGSVLAVLASVSVAASAAADVPSRETQSAVDAYLASATPGSHLVGGAGQAGYDGGFWVRGGSFLLRLNLTLQTRWEGFDWDDTAAEPSPGGDLSGFSLPRATLKLSGDATCDVHYYAELEFGHSGLWADNENGLESLTTELALLGSEGQPASGGSLRRDLGSAADRYGLLREGWVEYESCPYAIFRMGLVKTPTTRQLMTPPEMQQFVDVSLASAFIGQTMPGYTDRNRDYGFLVHGAFGCDGQWQYVVGVTNGDGIVHRNVLDGTTSDDFAYSVRVNWDLKGHIGYEEGALRSTECGWAAAVGAWAHYYADAVRHNPFEKFADRLTWGVDAAAQWGGLSVTAAYSALTWSPPTGDDFEASSYLVQAGYLFPGTAWEVAARYSRYEVQDAGVDGTELAVAVTYYLDGHADKVTLDVTMLSSDDVNALADTYAGFSPSYDGDAVLVRLQWQLAL